MLKIKELRESIGITQQRLSELSGLDQRWIRKAEAGEIKLENITVVNMMRLLKGLSGAADGSECGDRIFEDFQQVKHAYIVTKMLLENQT